MSMSFYKTAIGSSNLLHRLYPLRQFHRTLFITLRKTRAVAGLKSTSSTSIAPLCTSQSVANHPSMVQALEHIPPAPIVPHLDGSEDDLTPPPAVNTKEETIQAYASHILHQRQANGNINEDVEEKQPPKRKRRSVKTEDGDTAATTKKTRTPRKAAPQAPMMDVKSADETTEEPKRKTPKKASKSATENGDRETPKKKTRKKSRLAKDETEYDSEGNEIVKKQRKRKIYPRIEYDIPPVERKETTFRGRLGYACLNTVLRATKPDSIFCSRTCRIASIEEEGLELPKGLGLMNVKDLIPVIEWNEQNKIRFMRMSSEMFPFASHDKYGYDLSYVDKELKEVGDLAKNYGHRLTMHPGQFTQLGSPKEAVVRSSIRELNYHCEIMDRMGLDKDGVMIIHMGGVYGDKPSCLERFKANYRNKLSDNVKARLVLENDEICYNVDDLLPVCNELNIPIIFDYHHDWINPSCEPPSVLIPKIAETWKKRGIRMKQHLSEPRPGAETVMEKRAHADRCQELPKDLPDDVDLMIEAKDKEQAVLELYRIYGLEDVIHDNLRPPDPAPGLQTKGRKSSLKKKTKETSEVDSDGEPVKLEDAVKEGDGVLGDEVLASARVVEQEAVTPKQRRAKVAKVEEEPVKVVKRGRKKVEQVFEA